MTEPSPKDKKKLFNTLARLQRGAPEEAMVDYQRQIGGGVYGWLLEHIGDLIHRMSEAVTYSSGGIDYVDEKVRKVLRELKDLRRLKQTVTEQLRSNADYLNVDYEEFQRREKELRRVYVEEHAKLPTYNEVQRLAQKAAVGVGKHNFFAAKEALQELAKYLASESVWLEAVHDWNPEGTKEKVDPITLTVVDLLSDVPTRIETAYQHAERADKLIEGLEEARWWDSLMELVGKVRDDVAPFVVNTFKTLPTELPSSQLPTLPSLLSDLYENEEALWEAYYNEVRHIYKELKSVDSALGRVQDVAGHADVLDPFWPDFRRAIIRPKLTVERVLKKIAGEYGTSTTHTALFKSSDKSRKNKGVSKMWTKKVLADCVNVEDLLNVFDEMVAVQCQDGTWDHDPYQHGLANGMLFMKSLVNGQDPQYLEPPEEWIADRESQPEVCYLDDLGNEVCEGEPQIEESSLAVVPFEEAAEMDVYDTYPTTAKVKPKRLPFLRTKKKRDDVIVETCGRNYHPEECREEFEKGFNLITSALQPHVQKILSAGVTDFEDWEDAPWDVVSSKWYRVDDEDVYGQPTWYYEGESELVLHIGGDTPYKVLLAWELAPVDGNFYTTEDLQYNWNVVHIDVEQGDTLVRDEQDGQVFTLKEGVLALLPDMAHTLQDELFPIPGEEVVDTPIPDEYEYDSPKYDYAYDPPGLRDPSPAEERPLRSRT